MTAGQIAIKALVMGIIISLIIISGFAYTTLLERKVLARLQHRVGPNRVGYIPIPRRGGPERRLLSGFLQPAADAVKLFLKEDPTPEKVDNLAKESVARTVKLFEAVKPEAALPKLPVARTLWLPKPNLEIAAGCWILAGGAHHTGFSMAVTREHLEDFSEMAGIEYLLIDESSTISGIKKELKWNDLYYHLARGL